MKIQYLGTAAAEGIPAAFCTCPVCENARKYGGREIRSRSQMLIDEELLIDFPPDTFYHAALHNLKLGKVQALIVTHDHLDHWFPAELINRHRAYQRGAEGILHVYGNEAVQRGFETQLKTELYRNQPIEDFVRFHCIHGGDRFRRGEWEFTAIPADHDKGQECLVYLCKKNAKTVFYGHDTGACLSEKAWEMLRNERIDFITLDATMGKESCPYNHMGLPDAEAFLEKLKKLGCVDEKTVCAVSHFSHNGKMTQKELEEWAKKRNILAAYDGMEIVLR